ncbi:hypothetical protein [Desulfobacula toluolica]|uniref:Uncharacterized protein n=1 Tax=Desulfobacula toluolica (strain DSM 7467 / Tol2) TaxID=651182 RepID=K0NK41_DESTT|nr:hypothetical protein [Desulfobacula toluolica]CCK81230.1 uncharacterized protein TOL2_C30730 [Desulfobacula toluolica Tol2]
MTYQDVLIQILSEVTGKPKTEVGNLFDAIKTTIPPGHKFDEELPPEKAKKILSDLRKEKSGILTWLAQGAINAEKKAGHA